MLWIAYLLLSGQDPRQDEMEQLKKRVAELEETVKKLQGERPTEAKPPQEEVDKLKKKVKRLEEDLEKVQEDQQKAREKGEGQEKPAILGALNPAITCFLNDAARIDSQAVHAKDEKKSKIDSRMFFRGAELDFRAAVDPYVDAVMILAVEQEASGEFAADVEEGYGIIKRLPILEAAPLGMRVKAGKYRAPIGSNNQTHLHDMPWTTRPLPIVEYLGSESGASFFEGGYGMQGLGVMFRPPFFQGSSLDLEFHVARAGQIAVTKDSDDRNPGYLGRIGFFAKPGETHTLSIALSGYAEDGIRPGYLGNLDVTYLWKPVGEFRSLVLGGELFYASRGFLKDDAEERTNPIGWYLYGQYQVNRRLYAGIRWDQIQTLDDDKLKTDVFAAYLSYYTSEYFRMRLGYEYRSSDIQEEDGAHSLLFELNFVFGSHPPEPWWVNR